MRDAPHPDLVTAREDREDRALLVGGWIVSGSGGIVAQYHGLKPHLGRIGRIGRMIAGNAYTRAKHRVRGLNIRRLLTRYFKISSLSSLSSHEGK